MVVNQRSSEVPPAKCMVRTSTFYAQLAQILEWASMIVRFLDARR